MKRHVAQKKEQQGFQQDNDDSSASRQSQVQQQTQTTPQGQSTCTDFPSNLKSEQGQQSKLHTKKSGGPAPPTMMDRVDTTAALGTENETYKEGHQHSLDELVTMTSSPFTATATPTIGGTAMFFGSPPAYNSFASPRGFFRSNSMTTTSRFIPGYQQGQGLQQDFSPGLSNQLQQPHHLRSVGQTLSNPSTCMPMSPSLQSYEDDDPFLLDRLWSQTLNTATSSKNPLVAVRPSSFGFEQERTTTGSWDPGRTADSRTIENTSSAAVAIRPEAQAIDTSAMTYNPAQTPRTDAIINSFTTSSLHRQTTDIVEQHLIQQERPIDSGGSNSEKLLSMDYSDVSSRNSSQHCHNQHHPDNFLQENDGRGKRSGASSSSEDGSNNSSNKNQIPFRELW